VPLRRLLVAAARLGELLEVVTRAERPPGAGEDDHMHVGVVVGSLDGAADLTRHAGVNGVETVGTIKGDPGLASVDLVAEGLVPVGCSAVGDRVMVARSRRERVRLGQEGMTITLDSTRPHLPFCLTCGKVDAWHRCTRPTRCSDARRSRLPPSTASSPTPSRAPSSPRAASWNGCAC